MKEIGPSAGTIEYEDTGGDGPVVVLLHGLMMDASWPPANGSCRPGRGQRLAALRAQESRSSSPAAVRRSHWTAPRN